MRALVFSVIVTVTAACGGGGSRPAAPAGASDAMPIVGLEEVRRGDSVDALRGRFGGELEGDALWVEEAAVEQLPASVAFRFDADGLRGATVAYRGCGHLDDLARDLDARLGKRTPSETGIAAWSTSAWDLALYCDTGGASPFTRLDIHPRAAF